MKYIIFVMGVSGSGKTTIGKRLSLRTGIPFFDGDDFHSEANKEKMKAGYPLSDQDRVGWLTSLNKLAKEKMHADGAIIACSALKEKYREILSDGITVPVLWIFLEGEFDLIKRRMEERKGHFMPMALLSSQFDTLEIPKECLRIDVSHDPEEIVELILAEFNMKRVY